MHNTIIEIDSKQFSNNLVAIRSHLKDEHIKICLPVKANAYGHGLIGMAKLAQPYVDYLAVACLDEGISLRQNGITKPILVFGAFTEEQIPDLIAYNLEITISSVYKAELVNQYCQINQLKCSAHLKIDTGMNRIGVRVDSAYNLIDYVFNSPHFNLIGIYSHLACSDNISSSFTKEQINQFTQIVKYIKKIKPNTICHLANSGGLCYFPDSYFDMIRPGILSYGYFPAHILQDTPLKNIKPCFSLKSKVAYFKVVKALQGISYNHIYIAPTDTRIITVPIGYGDGYKRALSNIGSVLINGQRYLIAGNICMDMLMVDIGQTGEAYVDDEVVLIGKQDQHNITVEEIAALCHTITYEILCSFNERIPRIYTKS